MGDRSRDFLLNAEQAKAMCKNSKGMSDYHKIEHFVAKCYTIFFSVLVIVVGGVVVANNYSYKAKVEFCQEQGIEFNAD